MTITAPVDPARVAWRASPAGYGAHFDPRNYKRPAHVNLIADAFRMAAIKSAQGIPSNTVVELPPRHSKSETVSHWGPTWLLDMWPNWRVMLGSYEAGFASEWGFKVRESITEHADELRVRVARGASARRAWYTTEGGGMFTAGVGGPFTGRGANCFIIDDPFKNYDDATSKRYQERVYDWYRSTAYTRLEPAGFVFVVMTRWHEEDLVGKLLKAQEEEGDEWNVVRLPALAEQNDLLGRREGAALWPERFTVERLLKVKGVVGSYLWNGMYQQRPAPLEGAMFKRSWWQWYTARPALHRFDEIILSWDMAFKDTKQSSYVVGQVWGRIDADKYLLDQTRDHLDFPSTLRAFKAQCDKWPQAAVKLVEDKANGPAVIATLKRRISGIIPIDTEQKSKEARAVAVSPQVESGNVYLPAPQIAPWIDDYVEELATFPNASNDDQVDATSQALHRLEAPRYESESYEDSRLHGRR